MRDGGLRARVQDDPGVDGAGAVEGCAQQAAGARLDSSFGPRQPILRGRLPKTGRAVRHEGLHVAQGELLRHSVYDELERLPNLTRATIGRMPLR